MLHSRSLYFLTSNLKGFLRICLEKHVRLLQTGVCMASLRLKKRQETNGKNANSQRLKLTEFYLLHGSQNKHYIK